MKSERSLKAYGFSHLEFHISSEISVSVIEHNLKEKVGHSIDSSCGLQPYSHYDLHVIGTVVVF